MSTVLTIQCQINEIRIIFVPIALDINLLVLGTSHILSTSYFEIIHVIMVNSSSVLCNRLEIIPAILSPVFV